MLKIDCHCDFLYEISKTLWLVLTDYKLICVWLVWLVWHPTYICHCGYDSGGSVHRMCMSWWYVKRLNTPPSMSWMMCDALNVIVLMSWYVMTYLWYNALLCEQLQWSPNDKFDNSSHDRSWFGSGDTQRVIVGFAFWFYLIRFCVYLHYHVLSCI